MSKRATTKKATKGKAASKKAKEPKAKKVGALDAAAQVLAGSKEPVNCKDLIEAMAKKGLWTSPGGKTPHGTLYSAIIREIALRGKESRFVKKDRREFAAA
jgi:HB1, ASXL, restriction endonuclease HTH domain